MFKRWIQRNIEEFIAWYIFRYGHGALKLHRKGGAVQIARIFSEQANERIVQPAFDCKGIFYTREQLDRAIKETVKAVRNCGEDSDCWECYLHIKEDDCVMNHVDNESYLENRCITQNNLISKSALLEALKQEEKECEDWMIMPSWSSALSIIEKQPIVDDMEQIVKQLEEKSNDIPMQYENNYEQGFANGVDYAIDIVKKEFDSMK